MIVKAEDTSVALNPDVTQDKHYEAKVLVDNGDGSYLLGIVDDVGYYMTCYSADSSHLGDKPWTIVSHGPS